MSQKFATDMLKFRYHLGIITIFLMFLMILTSCLQTQHQYNDEPQEFPSIPNEAISSLSQEYYTECFPDLVFDEAIFSPSQEYYTERFPDLVFDEAAHYMTAEVMESDLVYQPHISADETGIWGTWLEYEPGKGDWLYVSYRIEDIWLVHEAVNDRAGRYARPTLTCTSDDSVWLSYEMENLESNSSWDIYVCMRTTGGNYSKPICVSPGSGVDINHSAVLAPDGGLWVTWQSDIDGQFDILARHVSIDGSAGPLCRLSNNQQGDWSPAIAVTGNTNVCVIAWDSYDGDSYNVLYRVFQGNSWSAKKALADSGVFEGHVRISADNNSNIWFLWEKGEDNWGHKYVTPRKDPYRDITDTYGPLHRFRTLQLAVINTQTDSPPIMVAPVPMPALESARNRSSLSGITKLGTFYESGDIIVDEQDRPWIIYKHYYLPALGVSRDVSQNVPVCWRLYARCLSDQGWGDLYSFDIPIRYSMQRVSADTIGSNIYISWATGNSDRFHEKERLPNGIAMVAFEYPFGQKPDIQDEHFLPLVNGTESLNYLPDQVPTFPNDEGFSLFFGDLHRHTEISKCKAISDGTIDDAYRYAIDVAQLNFLAITDHSYDFRQSDNNSLVWWQSSKEVTRHQLRNRFVSYFGNEWTKRHFHHTVISLNSNSILHSKTITLPELWENLNDDDTMTIPHCLGFKKIGYRSWSHSDNDKRPLAEIYQGRRGFSSPDPGLNSGYHFGFIASSDHLSTSASYACVWAPNCDDESIFRSMQARRTYAATDKIQMMFKCGDHWMGEIVPYIDEPSFSIDIQGTSPISNVEIIQNGESVGNIIDEETENEALFHATWSPDNLSSGENYFYIKVWQSDGNQAWSSPIWIEDPEATSLL